jgi:LmbE family N-acetylglucosaminyl deacetylase
MVTPLGEVAWAALARAAERMDAAALTRLAPMMIVAPHQDDETLGCGGLIASATALGLRPRVAYLTDGAASHTGSPTWPAARIAATRRREAIEALAILGVPATDIRFLDWPDAAPRAPGSIPYESTVTDMLAWMDQFAPASLWSPWSGEAHCDHRAASQIARDLASRWRGARLIAEMSYLVWGWAEAGLIEAARPHRIWALPCRQTVPLRRRALARHRTQMTDIIDDADRGFTIPARLAAVTDRPLEMYLGRP